MYTSTKIKYSPFHRGVFTENLEMFCTLFECHHVSDGSQVPDSNEPSVRLVPLKCLLNTWSLPLPHLAPSIPIFSFTDSDGILLAIPAHFLKSEYVTASLFFFFKDNFSASPLIIVRTKRWSPYLEKVSHLSFDF